MTEDRIELRLSPTDYERYKDDWTAYCTQVLGLDAAQVGQVRLDRKSLDARKAKIRYNIRLQFHSEGDEPIERHFPSDLDRSIRIVIVGFGPAGMFCALKLLELGHAPLIIERGKPVKDRRRDVAQLNRAGEIDPESNYCFGEGGAGTFSDGKLYTRSHKRGKIEEILDILVEHGADPAIRHEAHPHIGTNKLPGIIERMRERMVELGAILRFSAKLTDVHVEGGKVVAVDINGQREACDQLVLATGHSARDIYELLHRKGIAMEAKPFAMGFRIEHPQDYIDQVQYHRSSDIPILPPASYSLVEQVKGKGVFSFCMCPGGIIAPAATAEGERVVNGWSPSKRNGPYANSGWVTEIGPQDWKAFEDAGPLAGLRFQQYIEQKAAQMAGGSMQVPAQNLRDYLQRKQSAELHSNSYHPGTSPCDLHTLYPPEVDHRLWQGLLQVSKKVRGFDHAEAVVVAPESRTSAPVRIPRGADLQHPEVSGLFPCGEGAGYAGGILSAAMDGQRVARGIVAILKG